MFVRIKTAFKEQFCDKGRIVEVACVLLYIIVFFTWFSILEDRQIRGRVIYSPADFKIPFCEYFIIPYYLWFAFMPVTYMTIFLFSHDDFRKAALFAAVGALFSLLIYTVAPTWQPLRPRVFRNDNFLIDMTRFLYEGDTPTNVCPSIHVLNTIIAEIGILKARGLRKFRFVRAGSLLLSFSIILSVLFVKQHSIIDVGCAFVIAALLYPVFYRDGRKSRVQQKINKFQY